MQDSESTLKSIALQQRILLLSVAAVIAAAIGMVFLTESHGPLATALVVVLYGGCLSGMVSAVMLAFRLRAAGFGSLINPANY